MTEHEALVAFVPPEIELDVTHAALVLLASEYEDLEATDPASHKLVTAACQKTRGLRRRVEERRVGLKAPALKFGRELDAEAKRLTGILNEIEAPLVKSKRAYEAAKRAEKEAKERAERERLDKLREKATSFLTVADRAARSGNRGLMRTSLAMLTAADISTEKFGEFTPLAIENRDRGIEVLVAAIVQAEAREAERARMETQRLEQEAAAAKLRAEQEELAKERAEMEAKAEEAAHEMAKLAELRAENARFLAEIRATNARLAEEKAERERADVQALRNEALRFTERANKMVSVGDITDMQRMREAMADEPITAEMFEEFEPLALQNRAAALQVLTEAIEQEEAKARAAEEPIEPTPYPEPTDLTEPRIWKGNSVVVDHWYWVENEWRTERAHPSLYNNEIFVFGNDRPTRPPGPQGTLRECTRVDWVKPVVEQWPAVIGGRIVNERERSTSIDMPAEPEQKVDPTPESLANPSPNVADLLPVDHLILAYEKSGFSVEASGPDVTGVGTVTTGLSKHGHGLLVTVDGTDGRIIDHCTRGGTPEDDGE